MGIIKRQGIQNTIISYAGVIIGFINVVILLPTILEKEQVGLTRLLVTIALIYAQFSALGFSNAGVKFFPYFRDKLNQHNSFLSFFLGVPLAGFILVTILFFIFKSYILGYYSQESGLILKYYYYILPLGFFTLLFNLLNAYLISLYKTVVPSFVQDFLLRILITLVVSGYAWELYNFEVFMLLFVIANCSVAFFLFIYIVWLRQFFINLNIVLLKEKPLKPMLRYGFFSFMGNISSTIIMSIDSIMIGHYNGLGSVGVYTTAAYIARVILIPGRSLYKIAWPQIADFWKTHNIPGLAKLYQQVTRINMVIGCLLFIGIWANINNMFALLPDEYSAGRYVIFFIGLARLVDLATGINGHILLTSSRYHYDLLFNIALSLLIVVSNIYFIQVYGINGAAFATMMAYILINLLRLLVVWLWFGMQPFNFSSLQIIGISLIAYGAGVWLPILGNTVLDIIVRSALITLIYGTGVLILNLAPEVTDKFLKYIWKSKS